MFFHPLNSVALFLQALLLSSILQLHLENHGVEQLPDRLVAKPTGPST